MPEAQRLHEALAAAGLEPTAGTPPRPVSGGDISAAWRIETASGPLFVKSGPLADAAMLDAEAAGLAALSEAGALRVPAVRGSGSDHGIAWLALEWLDLGRCPAGAERTLGECLAALHQHTAERHGWHRDNFIGRTPQPNAWRDDWVAFYREQRLAHQLELAAANGFGGEMQDLGARLLERLPAFFDGYEPVPSLIHGDLWGGNWACCGGEPVIYDPAAYYGDREAELAMTRLFGGFGRGFYDAYAAAWPLAPGHEARDALYRLYHVLNHANLFGGGYAGQAVALLRRLTS